MQGQYDTAIGYFQKAYSIEQSPSNWAALSALVKSRVLYGIGLAHQMVAKYTEHVRLGQLCLERLFDWKDTRLNAFAKEIPEHGILLTYTRSVVFLLEPSWLLRAQYAFTRMSRVVQRQFCHCLAS